jgi:hypothetical protein
VRGTTAALVAALAFAAGCAGSSTEVSPTAVKEALEGRLADKQLSFEWVYCLRTRRTLESKTIFRCNVNFGEPHIVVYCATLEDGALVTNRERPALRCGRTIDSQAP